MGYVKTFSIDADQHPNTLDYIAKWKKQGINISEKICQLIDAEEASKEERGRGEP